MPPMTEERLNNLKQQAVQLEKQRAENAQAYASRIQSLQIEVDRLTGDVRDLNKVIADHVKDKQNELDNHIAIANGIKTDAIKMKNEANALITQANAKTEEANKIHEAILIEAQQHEQKIKDHINTVSSAHADIDKRHGQCAEREENAINIMNESNKRIDLALMAENKAQEEVNKISTLQDAIKADIEIQKDLYFKNKQLLDQIKTNKIEVEAIKAKSDFDMAEAIKIRDNVDKAQARIERTSQEIIKRNDECKSREIQIKVTEQTLKDRKAYLDGQEGRLNELRNNVNALLEKQQATDSTVVPSKGA